MKNSKFQNFWTNLYWKIKNTKPFWSRFPLDTKTSMIAFWKGLGVPEIAPYKHFDWKSKVKISQDKMYPKMGPFDFEVSPWKKMLLVWKMCWCHFVRHPILSKNTFFDGLQLKNKNFRFVSKKGSFWTFAWNKFFPTW